MRVCRRALQDDPDALAQLATAAAGVEPEHLGVTAVTRPVALEDLDRRRLPGAVRPEQRDDLARLDLEGDTSQRVASAIALDQTFDANARLHDGSGYAHAPFRAFADRLTYPSRALASGTRGEEVGMHEFLCL